MATNNLFTQLVSALPATTERVSSVQAVNPVHPQQQAPSPGVYRLDVQGETSPGTLKVLVNQQPMEVVLPNRGAAGQTFTFMSTASGHSQTALTLPPDTLVVSDGHVQTLEKWGRGQQSGSLNLSATAQFIQELVGDSGAYERPVQILPNKPLIHLPAQPEEIAQTLPKALAHSIQTSGLFYESHQAQWLSGRFPLSELKQEPQSHLNQARVPSKEGETVSYRGQAADDLAKTQTNAEKPALSPDPVFLKKAGENTPVYVRPETSADLKPAMSETSQGSQRLGNENRVANEGLRQGLPEEGLKIAERLNSPGNRLLENFSVMARETGSISKTSEDLALRLAQDVRLQGRERSMEVNAADRVIYRPLETSPPTAASEKTMPPSATSAEHLKSMSPEDRPYFHEVNRPVDNLPNRFKSTEEGLRYVETLPAKANEGAQKGPDAQTARFNRLVQEAYALGESKGIRPTSVPPSHDPHQAVETPTGLGQRGDRGTSTAASSNVTSGTVPIEAEEPVLRGQQEGAANRERIASGQEAKYAERGVVSEAPSTAAEKRPISSPQPATERTEAESSSVLREPPKGSSEAPRDRNMAPVEGRGNGRVSAEDVDLARVGKEASKNMSREEAAEKNLHSFGPIRVGQGITGPDGATAARALAKLSKTGDPLNTGGVEDENPLADKEGRQGLRTEGLRTASKGGGTRFANHPAMWSKGSAERSSSSSLTGAAASEAPSQIGLGKLGQGAIQGINRLERPVGQEGARWADPMLAEGEGAAEENSVSKRGEEGAHHQGETLVSGEKKRSQNDRSLFVKQSVGASSPLTASDQKLSTQEIRQRLLKFLETAAMAEHRTSQQALLNTETIPLLRQQLQLLSDPRLAWGGEIWPGQWMDMEIVPDEHQHAAEGPTDEKPTVWRTTMTLRFPHLGEIQANLWISEDDVRISLRVHQPEKRQSLQSGFNGLYERLKAIDIPISILQVEENTTSAIT